jgi:hypothetical protein
MAERNWAEHDRRLRDEPTLEECRGQGASAAGYGWSPVPWGHWSDEQKAAYYEGHRNYKGPRG